MFLSRFFPNIISVISRRQLTDSRTCISLDIEDIWGFFSVKDRNLFHRVDTIGNIFKRGAATSENITDGVHEMK